ncbi:hypothetical protein EPN44_07965 [bacterium]|nr:MAG: hypothetical protein EPN44_07965 [bacterium]
MADALRWHGIHRASPLGFLQGPFVVSARRVRELLAARGKTAGPVKLSIVVDYLDHRESIVEAAAALAEAQDPDVTVAMVEMHCPSAAVAASDLRRVCEALRAFRADAEQLHVFLESSRMLASGDEPILLASAVAALRSVVPMDVGAKLRCGGITRDALPSNAIIARFITAMRDHDVPWKATAGLHHPVCGVYGGATMHGFLNVLAATLMACERTVPDDQLVAVLGDACRDSFRLSNGCFMWRDHGFDMAAVTRTRHGALRSFGSCSFEEPADGLRELGLLP